MMNYDENNLQNSRVMSTHVIDTLQKLLRSNRKYTKRRITCNILLPNKLYGFFVMIFSLKRI